ncbi:Synaptotagmin-like protein 5 [Geodia barretti]|uniref:Synaptotagmin-like protein 5 n=1 Tax=Geodia barretti TaxID=519541 RepID=A0AA35TJF3_GEOBA|nr:Synaptotagmin-like protein 5 [Geodia barretti]
MAKAVALRKQPLLLDLSFLTGEERAKLEAVVRADENMLVQDRVRVGTLRQELEKERYFQKKLLDKPQCTCCEQRLGRLFNTGAPCPNCFYRVCKRCRILSQNPPPPFVCPYAPERGMYTHVIIIYHKMHGTTLLRNGQNMQLQRVLCNFVA